MKVFYSGLNLPERSFQIERKVVEEVVLENGAAYCVLAGYLISTIVC